MTVNVKCFLPDGTCRAIWSGAFARSAREHDVLPVRGSNVIAITEGPRRGFFHVDFSALADTTKDDRYRVCLVETFDSHEAAVVAEHQWLIANWVVAT